MVLDQILGRPSAGWRRVEVLLTVYAVVRLIQRNGFDPPLASLRKWNRRLSELPAWKIIVGTLCSSYLLKNLNLLMFLNAPEPMARLYTRNFYRATWVLTALQAGSISAHKVWPAPLRHVVAIFLFIVYLFYPTAADLQLRNHRALCTAETLRAGWNVGLNPILRAITFMDRGFLRIRQDITLPRPVPPSESSFSVLPDVVQDTTASMASTSKSDVPLRLPRIRARIYFAGSRDQLRRATTLILNIPGGGFVAMPPKCHDDMLSLWARQTGFPVLSIDYGKAPEFPYPWALEECFDAYRVIVETNGAVAGLEGWWHDPEPGAKGIPKERKRKDPIRIIVAGDSAGGNLSAALTLKILNEKDKLAYPLPLPAGLILIYPCLSFDMVCWMPNQDRALLRSESSHSLAMQHIVDTHERLEPSAPFSHFPAAPRSINVLRNTADHQEGWHRILWSRFLRWRRGGKKEKLIKSSLSMTSRMSYVMDRMLTPEQMRAMALMYLGNSPVPIDFASDYYLSPQYAPLELLARFPRTFLICGEKDPFIDDTVIFGLRLREAREAAAKQREAIARKSAAGESSFSASVESKKSAGYKAAETNGKHVVVVEDSDEQEERDGGDDCGDKGDDEHEPSGERGRGRAATPEVSLSDFDAEFRVPLTDAATEAVRVKLLEGISHGFTAMFALLPEARPIASLMGEWVTEMVQADEMDEETRWRLMAQDGEEWDDAEEGEEEWVDGVEEGRAAGKRTGSPPPRSALWKALGPLSAMFVGGGGGGGRFVDGASIGSESRLAARRLKMSRSTTAVNELNFLERRRQNVASTHGI